MDNNSLVAIILDVVVFLCLLYAIYYILRLVKKKPVAPVTTKPVTQTPAVATPVQPTPEPKPVPQTPVVAVPVQLAVTEGDVKVKQPESQATKVSMESTPAPKPVPQAPEVTAPVQPAPELKPVPQAPVVAAPKAEPVPQLVKGSEVKVKQTESRATKVSTKSAQKTMDRGSKIIDIEGIGPVNAAKLNSVNIYTTYDLLKAGETPLMRRELAEKTGISHNLILRWVNVADLFRIRGVGEEYSDLLEASGVDTVVELANRVPEHLHAKMLEVNGEKKLVRRPPGLSMVENWVKEAKTLPRKIEY
jgi:predicted flap endonuclease-1-like 5' DNA nuclease